MCNLLSDCGCPHNPTVALPSEGKILGEGGRVCWDMSSFAFEDTEDCPATVNPSLWRQARLNSLHGLYEVTPGVYQVRHFDISNITFIETDGGVIPESARMLETTVLVPVGSTKTVEFVADEPGDWVLRALFGESTGTVPDTDGQGFVPDLRRRRCGLVTFG